MLEIFFFQVLTTTDRLEWKLDSLKDELRKRNAKVSGIKGQLIECLIYLDSVGRGAVEPEPGISTLNPSTSYLLFQL